MKKKKRGRKTVGTFKMIVNGQSIEGQKYAGGWFWNCPSLPFIARDFDGAESVQPAVDAFMRRTVQAVSKFKMAMIEIG